MVAPLKVGIAGLGTVGAEVVRLIEQQGRALALRCGRPVRVVAVTARSKAKKRGLDLQGIDWAKSPLQMAAHPDIDCFVELMGGAGEPALSRPAFVGLGEPGQGLALRATPAAAPLERREAETGVEATLDPGSPSFE